MDLEDKTKVFYDKDVENSLIYYNKKFAMLADIKNDLKCSFAPLFIEYYCKIHNKTEYAKFIGTNIFSGVEVHLYNVHSGHTFSYQTMKEIEFDLKSDKWWNSYRPKEPKVNDEEYWERFK